MQDDNFIQSEFLCQMHGIEPEFIHKLHESGLIEIVTVESQEFIHVSQLGEVEKMIRLHYDLQINIEGIEAITHLVRRIQKMQDELDHLKNQLRHYELQEMQITDTSA
jgi:chaperone modulatory protein CbpM